jgi:anthranilate synthase component II
VSALLSDNKIKVLMIDNYDSFTFNLVHYLEMLNADVVVRKNDQISLKEIAVIAPTHLVISPGPCSPNEAGMSLQIIQYFKERLPILGVCLGHQAIGQCFGAQVVQATKIMHGKTSKILHRQQGVFAGLTNAFQATRYHSLVLQASLSPELELTAWTEDSVGNIEAVMGIRHKKHAIEGVQFHPESIKSDFGLQILSNFLKKRDR